MNTKRGYSQSPEHIRRRIANGLKTRAANFVPTPPRPCSVPGCSGPVRAREVCDKHYQRLMNHGSTNLPIRTLDVGAYLVRRSLEEGECRVWIGVLKLGYGTATINGRNMPAHVASWVNVNGPVPAGRQINHKCHNRACIAPDHLYAGTQLENVRDMWLAGRAKPVRGAAVATCKLTEQQVLAIRASSARGTDLAREYGVSPSLIRAIRLRQCWKWLDAA